MQPLFLSCTVIGSLPNRVAEVTLMTPGQELYRLESISRIQPLEKNDLSSSALITFVEDDNLPKVRMVLRETYAELMEILRVVTLKKS